MSDRARSLRRIEAVQTKMVRLCEWRIAVAQRTRDELDADRLRLRGYLVAEDTLDVPLAKAALRSLEGVERRRAQADADLAAQTERRNTMQRRERVVGTMAREAMLDARRAEEDRTLALTIEAWIAAGDADPS